MSNWTCYFSTGLCGMITCCLDNKFTANGYPLNACPEHPCEKYQNIAKDEAERQRCYKVHDTLMAMQQDLNHGRGIVCVQEIAKFISWQQFDNAKAVYEIDGDKICGKHPDIDKFICETLCIEPRYKDPELNRW